MNETKATLNASVPARLMLKIDKKNPYDNRSKYITTLLRKGLEVINDGDS